MRLGIHIIVSVVAAAASLHAADKPDPPSFEQYKQWHDLCLDGDTKDIDAQIRKFETRLARNPKDHLAQAYLGSACALRAKAGIWGPTKLKFLERGKSLLDAAVSAAPDDPRVRMIRAIGYYKVPKRFGVRATSLKDFGILIPIARNPQSPLKINERQAVLYYAYLVHHEEGLANAADLKAACHQLSPDSPYGRLTR